MTKIYFLKNSILATVSIQVYSLGQLGCVSLFLTYMLLKFFPPVLTQKTVGLH